MTLHTHLIRNNGNQSTASSVIFKVFINKGEVSLDEVALTGEYVLDLELYPVPARNKLTVEFYAPHNKDFMLRIIDSSGKLVMEQEYSFEFNGYQKEKLNVSKLASGSYILTLTDGVNEEHRGFVKK